MRINCQVDINSRLLPTLNVKKTNKATKCQLALGRKPSSVDKTIYIMVSTQQNPSGNMFKVMTQEYALLMSTPTC